MNIASAGGQADAASARATYLAAEAAYAAVRIEAAEAEAAGNALAPEFARRLAGSREAQATSADVVAAAAEEVRYKMTAVQEWHDFIREPLRRTREEMRRRGMLLPDLPADIELGEDDG